MFVECFGSSLLVWLPYCNDRPFNYVALALQTPKRMYTDLSHFNRRSGFGRQNEGPNVNTNQQRPNGSPNPSPIAYSPSMQAQNSTGVAPENGNSNTEVQPPPETPKYFFLEKYAKLGVKGNFMPLAAQPVNVDLAEWLAHQSKLPILVLDLLPAKLTRFKPWKTIVSSRA